MVLQLPKKMIPTTKSHFVWHLLLRHGLRGIKPHVTIEQLQEMHDTVHNIGQFTGEESHEHIEHWTRR